MTAQEQHMRTVLVRFMSDALNEVGGAVIPDVFRRDAIPLTVRARESLDRSEMNMPGIELAGGPELEMLARKVGKLILKIMRTDEVLWVAVNAHADFGGWNVQCVPLIEHMKLSSTTDAQVMNANGINPETGKPR